MVRGKSWAKPRTFCRVASSFVTPHCGPLTGREVIHPPIPPTLYSHVVSIKSTQNRYSIFATHPSTHPREHKPFTPCKLSNPPARTQTLTPPLKVSYFDNMSDLTLEAVISTSSSLSVLLLHRHLLLPPPLPPPSSPFLSYSSSSMLSTLGRT
jgi:hypothetical protein